MSRVLAILALAGAALAVSAAPAQATNECAGLMVCVPVAGPWVLVPARQAAPRPRVEYQLSCPRGYIVGGLDAELSARAIDVAFFGKTGSPVNPGITTSRDAVFVATYVGTGARAPSFRPHIGCIPTSGGTRVPTSAAVFAPGQPTVRRVRNVRLTAGRSRRVEQGCAAGERLVGGSYAVGFYTAAPPGEGLAAGVTASQTVRAGRVGVVARAGTRLRDILAVVQVGAVCAGGQ